MCSTSLTRAGLWADGTTKCGKMKTKTPEWYAKRYLLVDFEPVVAIGKILPRSDDLRL